MFVKYVLNITLESAQKVYMYFKRENVLIYNTVSFVELRVMIVSVRFYKHGL